MSQLSQPHRILLFIHSMSGGGSERQMSYLANELVQHASIRLVTLDRGVESAYELDQAIDRVGLCLNHGKGSLISGIRNNAMRVRAIRNQIVEWKPDLLVSFCDSNNILSMLAANNRIPAILSERSDPRRQKLGTLWEWMRRFTYPRCMRCVVQTRDVGDYLIEKKLVTRQQIIVIPSAVNIPGDGPIRFRSSPPGLTTRRLVYVGRLSQEKNVDGLIRAWSLLRSFHQEWRLMIVGDGPERGSLQQLARKLDIDATIEWMLWSHDVWGVFQSADAYCLVSHYEGFSQSMLEAMASGLPIAVSDCSPSIREAIDHEVNGLIIPMPATPENISATLIRLLSDHALRTKMGVRAAETSREYDWKVIAPRWLSVCNLNSYSLSQALP